MSLTSAMGAGVAGLTGNSTRLAAISDNIANSGTYGYKKVSTEFDSLVLGQGGGAYSAGGVVANTARAVSQNGTLVSSSKSTAIAISGAGMLPVTLSTALDSPAAEQPMLLTRTGNFEIDKQQYLKVEESGLVLMGWPANLDGSIPSVSRDTKANLRPVRFPNIPGNPTTKIDLSVNLPASATDSRIKESTGETITSPVEYFGNLGTSEELRFSFTPDVSKENTRSSKWTMKVNDYSSNREGTEVASLVIQFSEAKEDASSIKTVTGDGYDPKTGILTLEIGENKIEVNMGIPGNSTQFLKQDAGQYSTQYISKNGSAVGVLDKVTIDDAGFLKGTFSTGDTRTLYQIPLVSVANYNGLNARSSQTFSLSPDSGRFFLWDSGKGPVGVIQGFARESSTTDIAEELTNMIQTQRAYASNAKVITTVDEMLQETMNIKR